MRSIIAVVIIVVLLVQFSSSIFGFDAKKSLKDEGVFGTVTRVICGEKGCK